MKGFARIFEAIIASIILLASLTFFFVPSIHESDWDDVTLHVLAQDVVESVYLNGTLTRFVKTDDKTELNNRISSMLPKTVDFSLDVSGIPNSIIYIACVDCTSSDMGEISSILNMTEFSYKMRNISIRVQSISLTQPLPEGTNILFFFDKTKIATYESQINGTLKNGGTVFLLSDIVQADTNGIIGSLFNLTWTGTSSQTVMFNDVYNSNKTSHFVAKYYANISGKNRQDTETETFTVFDPSGIAANDKTIASGTSAYVQSNYKIVNNNGRAVWFGDYNRLNHNTNPTRSIDRLVKAAIMWASGERFKLDVAKKIPAPVHFTSSIFVFDEDTYIVELVIWRVFF